MFYDFFNDPTKEVQTAEVYVKGTNVYNPRGLFSEQIFGPIKDYCCQCGKLRGIENNGKICERCNVICGSSTLRYSTFGYIKLPFDVLNPYIFKYIAPSIANYIGKSTSISASKFPLDSIYFYNPEKNSFISLSSIKNNFYVLKEIIASELIPYNEVYKVIFDYLIDNNIESKESIEEFKDTVVLEYPVMGLYTLNKFRKTKYWTYIEQKLVSKIPDTIYQYLFSDKIPVLPPELRKNIQIDNKEITMDINKYYTDIFKMKDLMSRMNIDNEYYENIDDENEISSSFMYYEKVLNNLYKTISEIYNEVINRISGKKGLIRSVLIGKSIEVTGRAVIKPTLKIKPYEILIPRYMGKKALTFHFIGFMYMKGYDNYLISKILEYLITNNKSILSDENLKQMEKYFDEFIDYVNSGEIEIKGFFNRQPTIWPYSMLVMDVKINKDPEDNTIGIHPFVVEPWNADFDGDSVANCNVDLYIKTQDNDYKKYENLLIDELKDFEY